MSVTKDTLILTKNGMKKIQNINIDDQVLSKFGWVKVLSNNNVSSNCLKITDEYGYEVSISKNSNVYALKNDKFDIVEANNLNICSYITILPGECYYSKLPNLDYQEYLKNTSGNNSNRLNINVKFPLVISEDLAYFLGYSYGDGYVDKKKGKICGISLACSDNHPEIKLKLKNIIESEFGVNVSINKGDGLLETVDFYSVSILDHLFKNRILKQKAGSLIFPDKILYSDTKIQMAFLSGYFDADGCAQKSKKSYRIDSIDEDILKKFQLICISNGIVGRLTEKNRKIKMWSDIYRFNIVGAKSVSILKSLCYLSHKISTSEFVNKKDCVMTPYKCKDFDINSTNYSFVNSTNYISYGSFDKLKYDTNLIPHKPLIKSKISELHDIGVCDVYNLIVDGEGYWANGFYIVS